MLTIIRLLPATILVAATLAATPAIAKPRGPGVKPEVLYHNYCSVCHGDRGNGDSRAQRSLNPPPRDFTTAANLGREHIISVIRDGKPGTAMVGWGTQMSDPEVAALADYVLNTFIRIGTDPKLIKGKAVYAANCSNCHGERGQGAAPGTEGMKTPPRDLASPQARAELTRPRILKAARDGLAGTEMKGFKGKLPAADIEAAVDYVMAALMVPEAKVSGTSAHGGKTQEAPAATTPPKPAGADMRQPFPSGLKGDAVWGKKFYNANCATCHGVKGDGQGPRAYFINPKPVDFLAEKSRASLNRPTLYTIVFAGKLGTEMPAWRFVLSEQEIANVAEYVFQAFILPGQQKLAKPGK
jgi:mono/diheme cytochrome c family protein